MAASLLPILPKHRGSRTCNGPQGCSLASLYLTIQHVLRYIKIKYHLLLRRVDDNLINICPFIVKPVEETTDSDSIRATLIERELQRGRQDDALMRIPLVQGLDVLRLAIDYDAADAAELPRAPNTVRTASR